MDCYPNPGYLKLCAVGLKGAGVIRDKGQTHTKLSTLTETDWSILMVHELLFSCVKI